MKNPGRGGGAVEEGVRERSVEAESADWSSLMLVFEMVDSVVEEFFMSRASFFGRISRQEEVSFLRL